MSKQQKAKEDKKYDPKPVHPICSNCAFFTADRVDVNAKYGGAYPPFFEDRNLRCSSGGFAVKKTATCQDHRFAG